MKKLITIVLCALILISFAGCGKAEAPQECIDITNQFIDRFKSKDFEGMYALTNDNYPYMSGLYKEDDALNKALFDAITDNLSVEITGSENFGDTAKVELKISALDTESLLSNIVYQFTNLYKQNPDSYEKMDMDAELEKIVAAQIERTPVNEKDSSIDFIKKDGKWVIESNIGIYDDLSGGFLTYYFNVNIVQNVGGKGTTEQ